jgi:hypothetical protein
MYRAFLYEETNDFEDISPLSFVFYFSKLEHQINKWNFPVFKFVIKNFFVFKISTWIELKFYTV